MLVNLFREKQQPFLLLLQTVVQEDINLISSGLKDSKHASSLLTSPDNSPEHLNSFDMSYHDWNTSDAIAKHDDAKQNSYVSQKTNSLLHVYFFRDFSSMGIRSSDSNIQIIYTYPLVA